MRFWDSSALVPLLAPQSSTQAAEALLRTDHLMLVWWGTSVECTSALARLERERALAPSDVAMAQVRLRALAETWHEVLPHVRIRATAERLLRVHPLRAADALQLAAALEVTGPLRGLTAFVCFDQRLAEAAAREGLVVIEPGTSG
ncbi:MAG: type II toxin-antitoxin system VapC family toxin [Pseudomonadales bacterium]|nr:type II toxin-antitoxin system VapC family toxin [Pseudomonadales bacterium]